MLSEDGSGRGAALVAAVAAKDEIKNLNADIFSYSVHEDLLSSENVSHVR